MYRCAGGAPVRLRSPQRQQCPRGFCFGGGDGEGDKVDERKTFDWWGGRAEGFVPAVGTGEFFHPRSLRGTPWINSYSSGTAQLERLNWNALKRRVNVALMSKQSADTRIFRYTHYC